MSTFNKEVQIRWSDLDPNFHLRHSVYYDWGAQCRVEYLYSVGVTAGLMEQFFVGPIIFREECVFRKEIRFGDVVHINLEVIKAKRDFSRWTIQHKITKNNDVWAAMVTVDLAWLDLRKRKLAVMDPAFTRHFENVPFAADFEWMD